MATSIKTAVFWDVAQCCPVEGDRRLRSNYSHHLYRPDDRGSAHLYNVGILQRDYYVEELCHLHSKIQ
jgi:hypothetical protein